MDQLDGLTWRTSSYSGSNGGNCIEVATAPACVAVRDSKDPDGAILAFSPHDWQRFTGQMKEQAGPLS
jgi:hypothetical protein